MSVTFIVMFTSRVSFTVIFLTVWFIDGAAFLISMEAFTQLLQFSPSNTLAEKFQIWLFDVFLKDTEVRFVMLPTKTEPLYHLVSLSCIVSPSESDKEKEPVKVPFVRLRKSVEDIVTDAAGMLLITVIVKTEVWLKLFPESFAKNINPITSFPDAFIVLFAEATPVSPENVPLETFLHVPELFQLNINAEREVVSFHVELKFTAFPDAGFELFATMLPEYGGIVSISIV